MDATNMTEAMLETWKNDILRAVQSAMRREREEHDKKLEKEREALAKAYKESTDELKKAVLQLGRHLQKSEGTNTPTTSSAPEPIAETNYVRLLRTFEQAMEKTGNDLAAHNEKEVDKYIRLFAEQFSSVTNTLETKLNSVFTEEIEKLSQTLEKYAGQMTEQNRNALCEVQKENNLELQHLAEQLSIMAQENQTFRESAETSGQVLTQNMESLIENSRQFSNILQSHIADGTVQMEAAIGRQVDQMILKNAEYEKQYAAAFSKAMEDYRKIFVEANAQAMAQVQSDMLERMEETQEQMNVMAASMTAYFDLAKAHEERMQTENAQLIQTVKEHSESMNKTIKDSMSSVDLSIEQMREIIEERNNQLDEQMDGYTEALNESLKKTFAEYNKQNRALNDQIESIMKSMETLQKAVAENSKKYEETLKIVTDRQKQAHEIAKDDLKLLQDMVKKL